MYNVTCNLPHTVQKKKSVFAEYIHNLYKTCRHSHRALYTTYFCQLMCIHIIAMTKDIKMYMSIYICLFCDPMDCSLPGSSVYGILQARTLESGAVPSSRGSS